MNGVTLELLVGASAVRPPPVFAMEALVEVSVVRGLEGEEGFQIAFSFPLTDARSLAELQALFTPPARVSIGVYFGQQRAALFEGCCGHQEFSPDVDRGRMRFYATGKSVLMLLDLEQKTDSYPNQSASSIVRTILGRHASAGVVAEVTDEIDTPLESERVPSQQESDLAFLRRLARDYGHVVSSRPAGAPGTAIVRWGPREQDPTTLPPLRVGGLPGAHALPGLSIQYDATRAHKLVGTRLDDRSKSADAKDDPTQPKADLAAHPSGVLRSDVNRAAAKMTDAQIQLAQKANAARNEPVRLSATIDGARYGATLIPGRRVGVQGLPQVLGGTYLVERVKHVLKRDRYHQELVAVREGFGAKDENVS